MKTLYQMDEYFREQNDYLAERIDLLCRALGIQKDDIPKNLKNDDAILKLFTVDEDLRHSVGCDDFPIFERDFVQMKMVEKRPSTYDELISFLTNYYHGNYEEEFRRCLDDIFRLAWFKINHTEMYDRYTRAYYSRERMKKEYLYELMDDNEKDDSSFNNKLSVLQCEILDKYIRNDEVKDYFSDIQFDILDLLKIIEHGYVDFGVKHDTIRCMKHLLCDDLKDDPIPGNSSMESMDDQLNYLYSGFETDITKDDSAWEKHIEYQKQFIPVAEKCYDHLEQMINAPGMRCIYLVEVYALPEQKEPQESMEMLSDEDSVKVELDREWSQIFDSMAEIEDYIKDLYKDEDLYEFYIEQYMVLPDKPTKHLLSYTLHWVNGSLNLFNIETNGIWEVVDADQRLKVLYDDMSDFHAIAQIKFPYEFGTVLKVQTPEMEKPFYGVFCPDMDGNWCWYNFLYSFDSVNDGSDFVDLSYHNLDYTTLYTSWDWVERIGG